MADKEICKIFLSQKMKKNSRHTDYSSCSTNIERYESRNPLLRALMDRFLREIVLLAGSIEVKKILDLGCGEGFVINKLLESYPNIEITGLDLNAKALDLAQRLNPGIEFIREDIYTFPCEKKIFDLVMAIEVLEHMKKPEEVLNKISKLTRKYALLSIPHEPFFKISNFIRGKNILRFGNDPEHINNWTKEQFLKLLKKNKFKILKTVTPFPWVIVLAEVSA